MRLLGSTFTFSYPLCSDPQSHKSIPQMVDAVVAAAGLVKPCGITSIQIQFFKCFPKHAIRSSIIKSDSDCTAFTFCMYSIFIYVPFSKFLGTDILVTPICVLEQDNPDV